MMTAAEARKKMRGTKRVCRSCAVPFYDLSRDPIVCPACGAHYAPDVQATQEEVSGPAFAQRPSWGGGFRRQRPALATEPAAAEIDTSAKEDREEAEAVSDALPDEDIGLEQEEQDDSDISALLDREDVEEGGGR